jgi:hypothetical protein
MFWFVPYISDPVWNFTYVAYSLTSSKPAKNTKPARGGASDGYQTTRTETSRPVC